MPAAKNSGIQERTGLRARRRSRHTTLIATRGASAGKGLLGLREASAMAIGGMIGGGIFSVLGVTIDLAGNLAFAPFSPVA